MSDWQILEGDCIEVMASLPSASVDAVITSPPYAMQRAATYGGVPEAEYPAWTVAWMEQACRLLKPNGSAVINIRPHVRGGGISDYTLRTRLALRDAGWNEVDELIWDKGGAPFGHPVRPRRSWESLHWFAKHGRPYCNAKAGGVAPVRPGTDGVGRPRPGPHVNGWDPTRLGAVEVARVPDLIRLSTRNNENDDGLNTHPAVYPPALAGWVGKLVCPPGGTVLDPFSGSGSTGVACLRNEWNYIGIEIDPGYAAMSRKRLRTKPPTLFDVVELLAESDDGPLSLFDT